MMYLDIYTIYHALGYVNSVILRKFETRFCSVSNEIKPLLFYSWNLSICLTNSSVSVYICMCKISPWRYLAIITWSDLLIISSYFIVVLHCQNNLADWILLFQTTRSCTSLKFLCFILILIQSSICLFGPLFLPWTVSNVNFDDAIFVSNEIDTVVMEGLFWFYI